MKGRNEIRLCKGSLIEMVECYLNEEIFKASSGNLRCNYTVTDVEWSSQSNQFIIQLENKEDGELNLKLKKTDEKKV